MATHVLGHIIYGYAYILRIYTTLTHTYTNAYMLILIKHGSQHSNLFQENF